MRTKKALYNFIATISLQLIIGVCGLIVPILFIGAYGSEVNGLISSINQFLSYITLFEAGLSGVIMSQLYSPLARNDFEQCNSILADSRNFFKKIAAVYMIYVVLLAIIYPQIVSSSKSVLYISALVVILSTNLLLQYLFGISNSVFIQAKQEGYVFSILQIIVVVLNAVVVIFCIRINTSVHVLKLFGTVIAAISPVGVLFYVKKKYPIIKQCQKGNSKNIKQRWDGMVHHLCYYIQNNIDIVLLTFVDLKLVSVYSIYYMITSTLRKVFESFLTSFRSAMGDMYARGELDHLRKTFSLLEFLVYSLTVAIFTAVYFSLTPFIKIYTSGITDISYVNQSFAALMVIAEVCYTIRIPYHTMVNCTGLFKKTKQLAYQEAAINVVVSSVFVFRFGIIGVAIGTAISCAYRTIRYWGFFTKNVLELKWRNIVGRVVTQIIIAIGILLLFSMMNLSATTFLKWVQNGIIYLITSTLISFCINSLVYKNDSKLFFEKMNSLLKR